MTSGTRKPPPISMSSPRLTMTERPRASAASTSNTAAAPLFTTSPASASQAWAINAAAWPDRDPRSPVARSNSRLEYVAPCRRASGARPRFVWSSTPVALMTGCSSVRAMATASARARSGSPAAMARRAASTNSGWGRPQSASERANASTDGGRPASVASSLTTAECTSAFSTQ